MQEDDEQAINETNEEEDEESKGKIIRQPEEVLLDLIALLEDVQIGSIQLGAFVDIVDRYGWKLNVERQREREYPVPSLALPRRTANQSHISQEQLNQLRYAIADELAFRQVIRDINRSKAMIPGYYDAYTPLRSLAKELVRAYKSQLNAERQPGEQPVRPVIPLLNVVNDLEDLLRAVYKKTLPKRKAKLERKLQKRNQKNNQVA